jgi:hypothetical protein
MGERVPGPLEQEIENLINREVGLDPGALEALTGTFDEAWFASLPSEERRLRIENIAIRNTRAMRAAVLRLAHAIDTLEASIGQGKGPPEPL